MSTLYRFVLRSLSLLALLAMSISQLLAQPTGPPPDPPTGGQPPCWPPPCVPIDNGMIVLAVVGALLAAYFLTGQRLKAAGRA